MCTLCLMYCNFKGSVCFQCLTKISPPSRGVMVTSLAVVVTSRGVMVTSRAVLVKSHVLVKSRGVLMLSHQ